MDHEKHRIAGRVRIIRIASQHIPGFHACLDSVARERRYLLLVEALPLEAIRGFVDHHIEKDIAQYVALDGEQVVGWCDIRPREHQGFSHCGDLGMGLLAGYHGMGLGRRLLAAAIQHARRGGLERVELEVFASNHSAIALYEKSGFIVEGVKRNARKIDGAYDDLICMARFLDQDRALDDNTIGC